MKPFFSTELRFASLVAAIVGIYVFVIQYVATAYGARNLISFGTPNPVMLAVWLATFGALIAFWFLRLLQAPSKTDILVRAKKDILEKGIRGDHLIMRVTIFVGWYTMMLVFSPFKEMIGHITQFPFDQPIAAFEHSLLGRDAWEYTHFLFGGALPTLLLQMCYGAWFILMWLGVIFCIARTDKLALRCHFMLAFLLTWILVGSLGAYFLGSAGPCFYDQLFGGNRFAGLSERLHEIDASLKAITPNLGIASLQMQDWLWRAYSQKDNIFGGGISAMPSVHVAVAAILALGAYGISKFAGRAMTAYAVLVWVASVHLGWHYALDGVVGALMALAIWKFASVLTVRYILRDTAPELQALPA